MSTSDLLTIETTILRPASDEPGEALVLWDVEIEFRETGYRPGAPATWTDPGDAAEHDIEYVGAELHPDAPGGPLTEAEHAQMRAWFDEHYDEVFACANRVREYRRWRERSV